RGRLQALAFAFGAGDRRDQRFVGGERSFVLEFALAARQVMNRALPLGFVFVIPITQRQALFRAVEESVLRLLRQLTKRAIGGQARLPRQRLHHVAQVIADRDFGREGVLIVDRQRWVGDDLRGIDLGARAQAVTRGARAIDAVERERA